jgi:hypothetical protein
MMRWILLPLFLLSSLASAELAILDEVASSAPKQMEQTRPESDQKQIWEGRAGSSLNSVLVNWAKQAGWQLIWNVGVVYPLKDDVKVEGPFLEAVAELMDPFTTATPIPLKVDFYKEQRVISVSERK